MKNLLLIFFTVFNISFAQQSNPYDITHNTTNNRNDIITNTFWDSEISERILTTTVVLVEIVLLVFVLYYWKRTHTDNRKSSESILKKHIRAIRDEKIKLPIENNNSIKRKFLTKSINEKTINGKTITSKAKKFSVSKGELFLAIKIQQLQNQIR